MTEDYAIYLVWHMRQCPLRGRKRKHPSYRTARCLCEGRERLLRDAGMENLLLLVYRKDFPFTIELRASENPNGRSKILWHGEK